MNVAWAEGLMVVNGYTHNSCNNGLACSNYMLYYNHTHSALVCGHVFPECSIRNLWFSFCTLKKAIIALMTWNLPVPPIPPKHIWSFSFPGVVAWLAIIQKALSCSLFKLYFKVLQFDIYNFWPTDPSHSGRERGGGLTTKVSDVVYNCNGLQNIFLRNSSYWRCLAIVWLATIIKQDTLCYR